MTSYLALIRSMLRPGKTLAIVALSYTIDARYYESVDESKALKVHKDINSTCAFGTWV